jgi:peptide deformylase
MPDILDIVPLGLPPLREVAAPVEDIFDPVVQTLARDMVATVISVSGLGLAAPQVGHSLRLFVLNCKSVPYFPDAPVIEPTPVFNPVILEASERRIRFWEACLSFPSIRGLVARHHHIEVEFTDIEGGRRHMVLEGLPAIVFQHELDHLDGLVFLDRLENVRDIISNEAYLKIPIDRRVQIDEVSA